MKKLSLLLAIVMVFMVVVPATAETKVDGNQVTFTFKAPNANQVYLSGNFNGWSPTGDKMTKGADGVWSVTIKLKPGTYQYKFVVDGVWTTDESAASFVDDGFGGKNSVLVVRAAGVAADARIDKLEQEIATLKEAQGGFQFHGYARTGILVNEDGNRVQGTYWPGGAWRTYRLGNETDTFIETTFEKKWTKDDGSYALAHFLFAHQSIPNGNGWTPPEHTHENGDASKPASDTEYFMRESYVVLGNLPELANLTFWAGQRYYRRDDVHLNDWYWKDFTGLGAGVQGIGISNANLDIALMYHGDDKLIQQLIFTLSNAKIGPGTLEVDLAPTFQREDSVGESGSGIALAAKYSLGNFFGFAEGSSMIGLYYGNKLAWNPNDYAPQGTIADVDDATLTRILASGVCQISEAFEIQPILLYQQAKNSAWNMDETWTSIGARPIYHFNKNFAVQFELGYDKTKKNGADNDSGTKFSIAPTVTLDFGYYTRPQLRFIVNRFNPEHSDSYTTYGFQLEAWW